jgi:trehalose 6-phosphate phosphatase
LSDPIDLATRLPSPDRLALFLDIDGTLIDAHFGAERRRIEPHQLAMLGRLRVLLGDAVAVLTGRSIDTGDIEFEPMILPMAGLQGADRRYGDGRRVSPVQSAEERRSLEAVVAAVETHYPDVAVYWKIGALALVCRGEDRRPFEGLGEMVDGLLSPLLVAIAGRDCIDIGPADANKGVALKAFMAEPPFLGRVPVHIGDDAPDAPAFVAARELGGFGIALDRAVIGVDRYLGSPADTWKMIRAYLERWAA